MIIIFMNVNFNSSCKVKDSLKPTGLYVFISTGSAIICAMYGFEVIIEEILIAFV